MPTNKYFKCPFCDKRLTREDMVRHIEKNHMEELPEGFTPLRATFHAVNKRDFSYRRACRICKQGTEWDENKGRYNQVCENPRCKELNVEKMRRDMGDKLGINRQTKTAEGLEKMLACRRISGTYKFQCGHEYTYTGSYERRALEFFDNVLNIKPEDLMVPGPALKYELDGKTHIYIPDMYYIPYNLIIEIKPGGDKPNTNPKWEDSRRKMLAKEKYIIKHTDFNYIRLTNNEFSQVLAVFADLKMSLVESDSKKKTRRVLHVNEQSSAVMGAFPTPLTDKDLILVQYRQNNVFSGISKFAIANNPKFDRVFAENEYTGTLMRTDKSFLENCSYNVYIVKDCKSRVFNFLSRNLDKPVTSKEIYEAVVGHELYSMDQVLFEESCIPYKDYYYTLYQIQETVKKLIKKS